MAELPDLKLEKARFKAEIKECEPSENGLNQVTIRRTPDNVDISSMDRYNIRILKTVISMYKHEGFKCKLRWNKIGRENRVKDLKISW